MQLLEMLVVAVASGFPSGEELLKQLIGLFAHCICFFAGSFVIQSGQVKYAMYHQKRQFLGKRELVFDGLVFCCVRGDDDIAQQMDVRLVVVFLWKG